MARKRYLRPQEKTLAAGAKEGSHVVVHYTGVGAEKTAVGVKDAGKGTWEVTKGTVTKVGEGGKDVTVKLADGTEKTFDVSKEAAMETAHGVKQAGMYTGKAGDKVVLYSTVDPTKDVDSHFQETLEARLEMSAGDWGRYCSGSIECTAMVLFAGSKTPVTVTFIPAFFSARSWLSSL